MPYQPQDAGRGTVQDLPINAPLPPKPKIRKIEIEAAFSTPSASASLGKDGKPDWAWFVKENGLNMSSIDAIAPRLVDFDTLRLQAMDENAVEFCMSAPADPGIQGFKDPGKAAEAAKATNDFLSEQVKRHPDRLGGFASVSLHDGDAAAKELERAVGKLGLKGLLVNSYQETQKDEIIYLDAPHLTPLWEAIAAHKVPVYIHPRVPHQRQMFDDHAELQGAVWGFACEAGTHLLRLVYNGIFDRFPDAQVAVGHMGEMVPYMAWRIQHAFQYNPNDKKVKQRLQDYLVQNVWITTSGVFNTPALQCAIAVMGVDRVMFSIDYPFENMSWASDWIETVEISETDRQRICYDNAKKYLRL